MFSMELSKNFDFTKTCRLCLNQNNEFKSIFDLSIFEMQHSVIISECTDVTISENDELPKKICLECVECLNNFYKFRKLVVNSQRCLIDFLKKSQNNLNRIEKIENTIYIKQENLGVDFYEEPNVPTCPVKSQQDQYNFEQDLKEIENKFEMVEEKSEIYDNKPPTSPVLSSLLSETTQDLEVENKSDFLTDSQTNKEICTSTSSLAKGKSYRCKECGKFFPWLSKLIRHTKIHTEKPYRCKQCKKSFAQSSLLIKHERTHAGEKPYTCKQCEKGFPSTRSLKRHEMIHTGVKPHSCKHCGKSFLQLNHLKEHERIHTGEKPYTCNQCGKSFCKSSHLQRHKTIHADVKTLYKCNACGKSFSCAPSLRIHQKSHEGLRSYNCKHCEKSYVYSQDLKKHEKVHES